MGERNDDRPMEAYTVRWFCEEPVDGMCDISHRDDMLGMCGLEVSANYDRPMALTSPPTYPHRCVEGHRSDLRSVYPQIRHRFVGE